MSVREGSLEAPKRAPIDWQSEEFYDKDSLYEELERVYDICHGCRRCVSLCDSFPTLFDLVDESDTFEVDGVDKADYMKVVDQCFMCDLCAETKCPYLPPHEWAVDFPHLMLRAKAYKFKEQDTKWRDRLITSTDPIFDAISNPGIAGIANAAANSKTLRKIGDNMVGIHPEAPLPHFESTPLTRRINPEHGDTESIKPSHTTTGKVAIYTTCYGDHNEPQVVEDLIAVLTHNGVAVKLLTDAKCCGMPKLELGDLKKVAQLKDANLPTFLTAIEEGYDIIAPIPSCVLMYKQELPLMFPDDADVARIKAAFFDPFEYLMLRQKENLIDTSFKHSLGKVAYHVACHQRVQSFGMKTREFLQLIPDTEVTAIERCSGHDGTYAVKSETYEKAMKIARPVVRRVTEAEPDTFGSDCPMAGRLIAHGMEGEETAEHPISMVKKAYGI
ncbi:MAG: heterodisulfide reductase-related iron-sulfur binding cluster [Pseudomonadota bacterium]